MTAQPDLSLVAEMLRTPERFLDGSREEQANLCEQADNATGEARTVNRAVEGGLPPLPQAFFDEFGESADDRVQDYARDAIRLATPEQPGSAVRGEAVAWRDDHGNLYPCRESVDKYAKGRAVHPLYTTPPPAPTSVPDLDAVVVLLNHLEEIGRASCRERV